MAAIKTQDSTTIDADIRARALDIDTPTTALDCEMQELEADRYADGLDIGDSRYL